MKVERPPAPPNGSGKWPRRRRLPQRRRNRCCCRHGKPDRRGQGDGRAPHLLSDQRQQTPGLDIVPFLDVPVGVGAAGHRSDAVVYPDPHWQEGSAADRYRGAECRSPRPPPDGRGPIGTDLRHLQGLPPITGKAVGMGFHSRYPSRTLAMAAKIEFRAPVPSAYSSARSSRTRWRWVFPARGQRFSTASIPARAAISSTSSFSR